MSTPTSRLHWDPQDTMILQVSGRKHWKVYRPTRLHPLAADVAPAPKPTDEPLWDGILEEGDLIYLPRGWWHVAAPLDEPSLHLTVTIEPASGIDLLEWFVGQLKYHPEVRRDVPLFANKAECREYFSQLRRLVIESLSDNVLERFLVACEAAIPLPTEFHLPSGTMEQSAPVTMETQVRLAQTRRLSFEKTEGSDVVSFLANGVRWQCSHTLVSAMEQLTGTANSCVRELCSRLPEQTSPNELILLLTSLAMGGVIWILGPTRVGEP